MKKKITRARGLKDLLIDAVDHGAGAIEKVHVETTKRTFDVLEAIPGVDAPTKGIHAVHDVSVHGVYGAVRIATRAVGAVLDAALDAAEAIVDTERASSESASSEGSSSSESSSTDTPSSERS